MRISTQAALAMAAAVTLVGTTGCDQRLTPDIVRERLDNPSGIVTPDGMTRVTRDLFRTSSATAVENFAQVLKGNQGGSGTNNALPISAGVLEDVGDVFCIGGLVADVATFDACSLGETCESELKLDACVLRVGDGDESARGHFTFKLKNEVTDDADISNLAIELGGWENSQDDALLNTLDGQIALEVTQAHDDSALELVFASDFDAGLKRKERGFFDDGIEERTRMAAGMRFSAETDDLGGRGSLEILTFVDEDGGRQESVSVVLSAEGHRFDAGEATASASLEVRGDNGTFTCTWAGSSTRTDRDGLEVESDGECIDEDGETFSFSGTASDHS